jgi:hypothetical protein
MSTPKRPRTLRRDRENAESAPMTRERSVAEPATTSEFRRQNYPFADDHR